MSNLSTDQKDLKPDLSEKRKKKKVEGERKGALEVVEWEEVEWEEVVRAPKWFL